MLSRIKKIINDYKKVKYLAYHDGLTNLLNRNWLYENMNTINKKHVYFIDINNLHEINTKGHIEGDNYIKLIVEMIQYRIKKDDIFIRYAGDEFIIFSNTINLLESNNYYCVGFSHVFLENPIAIQIADMNMIKEKNKFINKNSKYGFNNT